MLIILRSIYIQSSVFILNRIALISNICKMALVYCQEEYYMIYNNKCMLQIDAGHNSPSTIFWEERTHNWGLPMLVVSLTTTEPHLLDHKY